jgi:hypothetical protein
MTLLELESRIATLEQKLARLAGKAESSGAANINTWIDQIHGTFQDDRMYRNAASLGRKWRKSHDKTRASR